MYFVVDRNTNNPIYLVYHSIIQLEDLGMLDERHKVEQVCL